MSWKATRAACNHRRTHRHPQVHPKSCTACAAWLTAWVLARSTTWIRDTHWVPRLCSANQLTGTCALLSLKRMGSIHYHAFPAHGLSSRCIWRCSQVYPIRGRKAIRECSHLVLKSRYQSYLHSIAYEFGPSASIPRFLAASCNAGLALKHKWNTVLALYRIYGCQTECRERNRWQHALGQHRGLFQYQTLSWSSLRCVYCLM